VEAFCENDASGEQSLVPHLVAHLAAVDESAAEQAIAPIDAGDDAVQLMTVHQAKGLEFTAVFCPGLVEDRFPMRTQPERLSLPLELIQEEAPSRDPRLAEERRLAFVALTRARRHLFLSAAERYEGGKRWKPSRFLVEMGFLPGPTGTVVAAPAPEPAPNVPALPEAPAAQPELPIDHAELPELSVSYSQLDEYRRCPRAYQYHQVYRLPTRPSPEQEFGVAVHSALRQVLMLPGPGQPPLEEALTIFDAIFTAARFCDPVNADLWQERGRDFIRALHRKGRLSPQSLHMPPEQAFTLRLSGFRVRGRIDRIDRDGERYRVIDYKTGDVKPEWELERDLQLGLYAIAAATVFNLKPVDLAICYLEDGLELEVLKTTSQLDADREAAEEAAAGISAANFTPRPEPWKCRHCDFRLVCDAAL
jgi:DNA helicase-2/ATP-dependent DNA helicase PcrA